MNALKLYFLILLCIFINISANSQNWLWVDIPTGINFHEVGMDVCVDGKGNVYSTGNFEGSQITFGNYTLTNASNGLADIYLVKYDAAGNVQWATSAGNLDHDSPMGITVAQGMNIILTGIFFSATITFDNITLTNANPGGCDIFLVKYNAAGNVIWAKSAGGEHYDYSNGVAADANGNIFITGNYLSNVINFDTIVLTNSTTGHIYSDYFIAKYDPQGNIVWVKGAAGSLSENGTAIRTDAAGYVITTGNFIGSAVNFGSNNLAYSGDADIFIVKYDSNGNVMWNQSFGDSTNEFSTAISTDSNQNIIVTGHFQSNQVTFGAFALFNDTISHSSDLFLVKMNLNGTVLWAQRAGTGRDEIGRALCTDHLNNIYLASEFYSPFITFGTESFYSPPQLSPSYGNHLCLAKFDSNGVIVCGAALETGGGDYNGIEADNFGNVYVAGGFYTNSILIGTDTLQWNGSFATVFTAKFSCVGVGIDDIELGSGYEFALSPNPAHNKVVIASSRIAGKAVIEIFNALGVCCVRTSVSKFPAELDIHNVTAGIYLVRMQNENVSNVQKLVVE